jgi:xanthine dehydrogenase accessory factor
MTWRARHVIETQAPQLTSYDLTPDQAGEDGLVCGGRMQVFIEPRVGTPTLCLFGAGHVSQALARIAGPAGFRVEVACGAASTPPLRAR